MLHSHTYLIDCFCECLVGFVKVFSERDFSNGQLLLTINANYKYLWFDGFNEQHNNIISTLDLFRVK